jgi:Dolichyl-phosphate-mannose-protein mannosyltransferase
VLTAPKYFRLHARYWPAGLVLICGAILGYLFLRTYVLPLSRQYQLDFSEAKWIEPPQFSPVAYFRYKVFLTSPPEQAWLQVAATDAFDLSVNGKDVAKESSLRTRVAGIYDIKRALIPGTNIIAVAVNRDSYPGSAQLLIRGGIKQPGHDLLPVLSSEQWKVTTYTGIVEGSEPWNSAAVPDEVWPNARLSKAGKPSIDWVSSNPLLFQLPPAGKWLLARDAPPEAIFATSIAARRAHQETWIQIASSGDLDVLVNDQLVTTVPTAPIKAKSLPKLKSATVEPVKPSEQEPSSDVSAPKASSPEPLKFEAYDISRWIKQGSNQIVAAVRSFQQPATFLAEGFTIPRNGRVERFQTDSSWQVLALSTPNYPPQPQHAIEAGRNGSGPWGYLQTGAVKDPHLTDFDTVAKFCTIFAEAMIAALCAWLLASWAVSILRNEPIRIALVRDSLLHGPITVALLFVLLLSYDYRFPSDWAFQPIFCLGGIVILGAVRLLHFANPEAMNKLLLASYRLKPRQQQMRRLLPYAVLAAIMVLGFALRYHDLAFMSFDQDEMGVIQKSQGIFVRGFPYNAFRGQIHAATTYELASYPLAIMAKLFGYSEWSMRLPACIFGTLTIGLLGIMGRRLFNWRTGLITALIHACMTINIRWAQNAFYVQQCQFFSLLSFWLFYEAIRVRPLHHRYLTFASISFCMTFLSWEGSGFILPALVIALLVVRQNDWSWLKEWHLYRCLFFVAALVIGQFCWRTLMSTAPYLAVGSGLSNVSGPSLFFLNFHYQPTFYLDKLLLSENHVPFTILAVIGCLFCWRQAAFRYVITLMVVLLVLYTNFLAALSPRYCYFYQPLLPLAAIAASVTLYDRLAALASFDHSSRISRLFAHAAAIALLILLFVQSNEFVIKDYYLSADADQPGWMSRTNTYKYDYRRSAEYVKTHFQPGDVIIAVIPHVFEYYSGLQGNFFLDTLFSKKVSYDTTLPEPVFVDKFRGYPTIRDIKEFLEATHRSRRTWLYFVPSGGLKKRGTPEVLTYLDENAKTVFESYRAKVYLIQGANSASNVAQSTQR